MTNLNDVITVLGLKCRNLEARLATVSIKIAHEKAIIAALERQKATMAHQCKVPGDGQQPDVTATAKNCLQLNAQYARWERWLSSKTAEHDAAIKNMQQDIIGHQAELRAIIIQQNDMMSRARKKQGFEKRKEQKTAYEQLLEIRTL